MGAPKLDDLALPLNFRLTLAERLRGLEGLPSYLSRLRRIEESIERFVQRLRHLAQHARAAWPEDDVTATEVFFSSAYRLDLSPLNGLIDSHNRYYPIEANLGIDVRSGRYLDGEGRPWRKLARIRLDDLLALL